MERAFLICVVIVIEIIIEALPYVIKNLDDFILADRRLL
jgi:hypothetical protein